MNEQKRADLLINSIIDWAIGMDAMGYLAELEEEAGISIDEALNIFNKALDKI